MQQKALYKLFFFFSLFLFWYLCFCSFYMKFSAEEGLSPDYTGGSHLLCLLPLNNVDIKPRTPELICFNTEPRAFFPSLSTPCKCL